jgi:hypothetical protein
MKKPSLRRAWELNLETTVLAVVGIVIGGALKSLFQVEFLNWLKSKPDNKIARLLLYRVGR